MSLCPPFMIRPPEESREKRKPGQEEQKPPMTVLTALVRQTWTSIWGTLSGKIKRQVELRSAPLEQRMKDARTAKLTDEQIEILLNDSNPLVRIELVHNDTISGDALEYLKRDPDVTVSTIARRKQMQLL